MRVLFSFILLFSFTLAEADNREEIQALENKYLKTDFDSVSYRYQDLPEDIKYWIRKTIHSEKISNFGEAYNEIDLIYPEIPGAQHQYTLLSDGFSVSILKVGGVMPIKWLLLVDRNSKNFACKYHIHWKVEFKEGLKYIIKNQREASIKEYLKGRCLKVENN